MDKKEIDQGKKTFGQHSGLERPMSENVKKKAQSTAA